MDPCSTFLPEYLSRWYIQAYLYYEYYGLLLGLGRFFSFWILYRAGRTPGTVDQPVVRPLPTHRTTRTQKKTDIHASSGILTHDSRVWEDEDSSCLRP